MHGAICAQTVSVHNLRCECVYNWRANPNLQVACSSWESLVDRRQASNRNDHAVHLPKMIFSGKCVMWPNHRFRSMCLQQLTAWAQQYLCSLIGMASYSGNSTAAYMCSSSTAERNQLLGLHPSICHLLLSPGYKK